MVTLDEQQLQKNYVQQLTERLYTDLYDRGNISLDGRKWRKIKQYSVDHDASVTCDYIHASGNRCNKRIHNVYVLQHEDTKELLKVGSRCAQKLLGASSNIDIDKLDSERARIRKLEKALLSVSTRDVSLEVTSLKQFSDSEKEQLIRDARREHILPQAMELLLTHNIALTRMQYLLLDQNLLKLKKEKQQESIRYMKANPVTTSTATTIYDVLKPVPSITMVLNGLDLYGISPDTTFEELKLVTLSLVKYVTMMSAVDYRKSINFQDIMRPIESHYEMSAALTDHIAPFIYEIALTYVSDRPSEYRMLHIDSKKMIFIYAYVR